MQTGTAEPGALSEAATLLLRVASSIATKGRGEEHLVSAADVMHTLHAWLSKADC